MFAGLVASVWLMPRCVWDGAPVRERRRNAAPAPARCCGHVYPSECAHAGVRLIAGVRRCTVGEGMAVLQCMCGAAELRGCGSSKL